MRIGKKRITYHFDLNKFNGLSDNNSWFKSTDFILGEIFWGEENSLWDTDLDDETPYMHIMVDLINTLYSFILERNLSDSIKSQYSFVCFNSFGQHPNASFLNNIENGGYIAMFPHYWEVPTPGYLNESDEFDLKASVQKFEEFYDLDLIKPESKRCGGCYKYSPEDLIVKVLPCFEEHISDFPKESLIYHSNEFQCALDKATKLREYAESKQWLEPLKV